MLAAVVAAILPLMGDAKTVAGMWTTEAAAAAPAALLLLLASIQLAGAATATP
jgi:hypothetical protein